MYSCWGYPEIQVQNQELQMYTFVSHHLPDFKEKLTEHDAPLYFILWVSQKKMIVKMFGDERQYFYFCGGWAKEPPLCLHKDKFSLPDIQKQG